MIWHINLPVTIKRDNSTSILKRVKNDLGDVGLAVHETPGHGDVFIGEVEVDQAVIDMRAALSTII